MQLIRTPRRYKSTLIILRRSGRHSRSRCPLPNNIRAPAIHTPHIQPAGLHRSRIQHGYFLETVSLDISLQIHRRAHAQRRQIPIHARLVQLRQDGRAPAHVRAGLPLGDVLFERFEFVLETLAEDVNVVGCAVVD